MKEAKDIILRVLRSNENVLTTPEPTVSSPSEVTPEPSESPSPDPIPADIPSINDSTEERVDYILSNLELII